MDVELSNISEFIKFAQLSNDESKSHKEIDKNENKDLTDDDKTRIKIENKSKNADFCLKWIYGIAILVVLLGWELFVVLFSWKQLNPCTFCVRHISDPVFIALLTTATANIIVLPKIVLKYLFYNGGKN